MKTEFIRNLPHFYSKDAIYDTMFRLHNTIPRDVFQKYCDLKEQLIKEKKQNQIYNLYNDHIDSFLDKIDNDKNFLVIESIRKEVVSAIEYHNNENFSLIAYCIMPNHVHLILNTFNYSNNPLGNILGSIKQFSATKANQILGKKGQFWHHESFDHRIRSRNELFSRIEYVKNNPVKANLVSEWEDWKGTFVDIKYQE